MTLIHNYIYREVLLMTAAIVGVLTFLFVAFDMVKVVDAVAYGLSIWIAGKFIVLLIPFALTLTLPTGLLAAVLIIFGRMSSDRELLAIKASGMGLAPIVAPVLLVAAACSLFDFYLVASVVPKCREEYNGMKHEIVTNNPMALLSPQEIVDKIPGWKILFERKQGNELDDVQLWRLDDTGRLATQLRAARAVVNLDLEHQQLVLTLFNGKEEDFPSDGDVTKVHAGVHGDQMAETVALSTFYDKVQKKLAWMTIPDIWEIIYSMQTSPSTEQASPYLTELQARVSFSITTFTFVVVGLPLAIQTQRRETSFGVIATGVIVLLYYVLGQIGHALKAHAGLYPELIIWAPNLLFQTVGFYLFHLANRK